MLNIEHSSLLCYMYKSLFVCLLFFMGITRHDIIRLLLLLPQVLIFLVKRRDNKNITLCDIKKIYIIPFSVEESERIKRMKHPHIYLNYYRISKHFPPAPLSCLSSALLWVNLSWLHLSCFSFSTWTSVICLNNGMYHCLISLSLM